MKTRLSLFAACLVGIALSSAGMAQAQAARTWVSGVGDDANPCSRTAPCKTFAGAISKTLDGGEISTLDPGSYGGVTITKSISIRADGALAGISASAVNGIIINAPPTSSVFIDGVDIEGLYWPGTSSTGLTGIKIMQAGKVVIRNSTIRNFSGNSSFAASVTNGTAILVQSTAPVDVLLENVILSSNLRGLHANSSVSQRIFLSDSTVFGNSAGGISVDGKQSTAYVAGSRVFANSPDLARINGGRILKSK